MKADNLFKKSQQQQIYERLYKDIVSGRRQENHRLPSVKKLAETFSTSSFTVQNALNKLAQQGYIIRKHGAGNYVAGSYRQFTIIDTVAICIESHGHVFGDLSRYLVELLCRGKKLPTIIDTSVSDKTEILKQMSFSDARFYLIHGIKHFPFEVLNLPSFKNKNLISLFEWASENNDISPYRIDLDWELGGEMIAKHLTDSGCANVLLITSYGENKWVLDEKLSFEEKFRLNPGIASFAKAWKNTGGKLQIIETFPLGEKGVKINLNEFTSIFKQKDIPTAIVGSRDVDAREGQKVLYNKFPELIKHTKIIGYGNTPWSNYADPQMTTIDMNIKEIAANAVKLIEEIENSGRVESKIIKIKPKLIIRET